mmetsp:Transcript_37670/g.66236  ORF Transcript_37670/g.66236 Transcript_37670/m.66236 type:complete len:316 (+) Transcript_37670:580-1527(+)
MGFSAMAKDRALIMNDVMVTFVPYFFTPKSTRVFRRAKRSVMSISSPRAKKGWFIEETMDLTMPLATGLESSTTLSSRSRITGRGTGAPGAAAFAGAASLGGAAAAATAARTSSGKTRPKAPVPFTVFKSMPFSRAIPRTFGVASTPGALVPPGAAAAGTGTGVATTGAATATGAGAAGAGAAGAGAAAEPAVSMSKRTAPTLAVVPTWEWTFTILPVCGLVSSTEALSLSTEQRLSISFTMSPSFTNNSVTVTSAIPSPMSASLNCSIFGPLAGAAAGAAGAAAGAAGAAAGAPPSAAMSTSTSPTFTVDWTLG